jgi:hypothetical protein
MSTHDSITRLGQGRTWRAPWRLAWRLLRASVLWRRGAARPVRVRRRERRRLSAIECALAVETPQLAAMFEMFAQLAVGESHDGAERMTRPARARRRRVQGPRRAHVLLLVAFASIVALCVTLSLRVHPSSRNCLASTSSSSSTSPGKSGVFAFRAGGAAAAFAPVRMPGCRAYSTNSK